MFVVDASVWVSRFVPADIHHEPSRHWLQQEIEAGTSLVAPSLVLAEVSGAISRRTNDTELGKRAVELLQQVPGWRLVPVGPDLALSGADIASESRLRGVDAIYVALAHQLGCALATWDREQMERGAGHIASFAPDSLIQS